MTAGDRVTARVCGSGPGVPLRLELSEAPARRRARLVRLRVRRETDLRGLDVTPVGRRTVDVVVRSREDVRRLAGLRRLRRPAADRAQAPGTLPTGRTDYRDLETYQGDLKRLVAAHPDLVRPVVLGTSVQGRPLEGVEIAADVNRVDGRPTHVLLGLQHAREWSSGEVIAEHGFELVQQGSERIRRLLERTRTFLFPVINPDGFVASRAGTDPLRRKNGRGVDLNRNHGAFWGGPGASDNPPSETYRGPGPFSEPEAQAVRAWSSGHHVMVVNAIHNFGGTVLHQPGFSREDEPGVPRGVTLPYAEPMAALAQAMAQAAGYTSGPAHGFYDATGAVEDWNYFTQGAFAYTTEIGHDGFQPPFAEAVPPHYARLREAFLLGGEAAADRARHALLAGAAPPGRVLRLAKDVQTSTSYVLTGTDGPFPVRGAARLLPDRLETTLPVRADGRFVWHVNPSTRPVALLAGTTEAWSLSCERPGGEVLQTRAITIGIGERQVHDLACGAAVIRITSARRAGRRLVVRLKLTGRVSQLRATLGRHRARAGRRFSIRAPRRPATLRITGIARSGQTVRAARRVR